MTDTSSQQATPPLVKVLFYPNDDYYTTTETLWAEELGSGLYRLRNSPWYIYDVAFEDVVRAAPAQDGMLTFVEVVARSGYSTFRLLLREGVDEAQFERFWHPLRELGCLREGCKGRLYAIDAPPGTDLSAVSALLERGAVDGAWDWEAGYWHEPATAQDSVERE